MDKSPEYMAMCDWPEIQEKWIPAVGDWTDKGLVHSVYFDNQSVHVSEDCFARFKPLSDFIWLPLQWQLQEMVKADAYRLDFKYNKYTLTLYPYKYDGQFVFTSPTAEQALLRGWFYWRYGKRWTGKKWKR